MSRTINRQNGFTLVEVIAAIALSLVVIDMAYLTLRFFDRQVRGWHDQVAVLNTSRIISIRFGQDIRNARSLHLTNGDLVLISAFKDTIHYYCEDGSLMRNGMALGSPQTFVENISFLTTSSAVELNEPINLPANMTAPVIAVSGRIFTKSRSSILPFAVAIGCRNLSMDGIEHL